MTVFSWGILEWGDDVLDLSIDSNDFFEEECLSVFSYVDLFDDDLSTVSYVALFDVVPTLSEVTSQGEMFS